MRKKWARFSSLFICVVLCLGFFGVLAFSNCITPIYASAGSVFDVANPDESIVEYDYPTTPDNFFVTLKIKNYEIEKDDIITYYYLKSDTNAVKYQTIKNSTEANVVATEENLQTVSEIQFNPLSLGGTGQYTVFANVYNASEQEIVKMNPITISIISPQTDNLVLTVSYNELNNIGSSLGSYEFSLEIKTQAGQVLNPENFDGKILWYFSHIETPYSNRTSFTWTPVETGNYSIYAKIDGTDIKSKPEDITVVVNRTLSIVLIVSGIVGVMTLWVVITTIIKVKTERVW